MTTPALTITPLPGLPRVRPGDDLVALIGAAFERAGFVPKPKDIIVIAQKIVSKSEGRIARLDEVKPSARANEIAAVTGKDPRQVQLVLDESDEVLRAKKNVMVVAHRLGLVMANAGIDRSNVEQAGDGETVLL